MTPPDKIPKYAVRLIALLTIGILLFFVGLSLFIPEGSQLTGSYDAASLRYIASQPTSYAGSAACGADGCHNALYAMWQQGAHGARAEQSKCEVCHGPQGRHPELGARSIKVTTKNQIVELCLSCHRKMKARSGTDQPQILPLQHPYAHQETLICTQCHNPHAPEINAKVKSLKQDDSSSQNITTLDKNVESVVTPCFGCHGPSGSGGFAPKLAGQNYSILKDKLIKIKRGEINSPTMASILTTVNEKDIEIITQYFSEKP